MARPNWEYIRVDVDLPDHEKLDGMSDKAFRTLIELWCWCGRHLTDGFVRDAKWKTFGTAAARQQLIEHGLAERSDGGYLMHDFTGPDGHQRSRAEVEELSARRSQAGRKGGMARGKTQASASASGKQVLKQTRSKQEAEAEAEAEADKNPPARKRAAPPGAGRGTRLPPDFRITADMTAWALENVPGIDTAAETMRFRDYWESAAGARARKADWIKTWRNWMRRAKDDLASRPPPRGRQQETDEQFARAMQRIKAREEPGYDPHGNGAHSPLHQIALPSAGD